MVVVVVVVVVELLGGFSFGSHPRVRLHFVWPQSLKAGEGISSANHSPRAREPNQTKTGLGNGLQVQI
jgi:hypothetical protein